MNPDQWASAVIHFLCSTYGSALTVFIVVLPKQVLKLEARRPRRYTDEPDENLYSEYHLSRVYYLPTSLLNIMNRNVVMGRWCRYLIT